MTTHSSIRNMIWMWTAMILVFVSACSDLLLDHPNCNSELQALQSAQQDYNNTSAEELNAANAQANAAVALAGAVVTLGAASAAATAAPVTCLTEGTVAGYQACIQAAATALLNASTAVVNATAALATAVANYVTALEARRAAEDARDQAQSAYDTCIASLPQGNRTVASKYNDELSDLLKSMKHLDYSLNETDKAITSIEEIKNSIVKTSKNIEGDFNKKILKISTDQMENCLISLKKIHLETKKNLEEVSHRVEIINNKTK